MLRNFSAHGFITNILLDVTETLKKCDLKYILVEIDYNIKQRSCWKNFWSASWKEC